MITASPAALEVARRRAAEQQRAERRLALWLCAPAAVLMLLVVGVPLVELGRLSLTTGPGAGPLAAYAAVLGSGVWWSALGVTVTLIVAGTSLSLALGLVMAFVLHRTPIGRGTVRAAVLVPYATVSVVGALGVAGLVSHLLPVDRPGSALAVVVLADSWRTMPFVALVLMAALALVPEEVLTAAALDGAGPWQRFTALIAPALRPALLSALVFRVLDTARTFDTVDVLTGGRDGTATTSVLAQQLLLADGDTDRAAAAAVLVLLVALLAAGLVAAGVDRLLPRGSR